MPYQSNSDLPETVWNVLPSHARDIYRETFNHAWKEYNTPEKRHKGSSQEETAHRVAWAAVKKNYKKQGTHWIEREETTPRKQSNTKT